MNARPGTYARACVRDLERAIAQALNRARALDYQLPRSRVRELAAALVDDLRQIRLLAVEFAPALDGDRACTLVDGLVQLHFVLVDAEHRPRARAFASRLAADLDQLRALTDEFVEARQRADTGPSRPSPTAHVGVPVVAPTRFAAGLVAHAVRTLPASHRARWSEELDAELDALAEAAASRWTQVGHATRVVGRIWFLRRALIARPPAGDHA